MKCFNGMEGCGETGIHRHEVGGGISFTSTGAPEPEPKAVGVQGLRPEPWPAPPRETPAPSNTTELPTFLYADGFLTAARNLLAVLHGDGGHHTERVGFVQSCEDAERVRHRLVTDLDAALSEVEKLGRDCNAIQLDLDVANEEARRAFDDEVTRLLEALDAINAKIGKALEP